jgi:hypothetical protein
MSDGHFHSGAYRGETAATTKQAPKLEWQMFGNSDIAHIVDTTRKETRRSGWRAQCRRYAGGLFEAFLTVSVDEPTARSVLASYRATLCPDCSEWLDTRPTEPESS